MHWLFQNKKANPLFLFKGGNWWSGGKPYLQNIWGFVFTDLGEFLLVAYLKRTWPTALQSCEDGIRSHTLCYKYLLMTPKALANTKEDKIWDEWEAWMKQKLQTFRQNFSLGISESPVTNRWGSHGQWGSQDVPQQDQNINMIPVLF